MNACPRFRVPFAISGASVLAGLLLAWVPADAAPGDPQPGAGNVARAGGSAHSQTKTLTRQFVEDDGSTYSFPSNTVTVTASETKDLRGRQRILISWSGAQPSGGRASNPYGENGLQQEYPVVIMQCRGTDDPNLPVEQQLRPETCWTNSVAQRSQISRPANDAIWTRDLFTTDANKGRLSGMEPFPAKEDCTTADQDPFYSHLTPFVAASGKVFAACDEDHMPPEAAVGAAFSPNEIAAFSDPDGNGSARFEVRSAVENESLGCNHKVACSIVVVPINGISCAQASSPPAVVDTNCRLGGQFAPGSSNFSNGGVDAAASPALWWSASNWNNRFSIPVTFGLPPDTCDVLDPRAPTGFYGSELMAQASLQWAPAYCLDKKRFKFQLNQMSDDAGWNLMEGGGGAAAFVSSEHKRRGTDPIGYAPTAVTGFAIGYTIDRPDNAGEFTELKMNPRLVAKLLTQSYLGSDLGRGHPGIGNNPLAITNDPEFIALNPGLSQNAQEAGAVLLSLSNDSDVIEQLTDWIAQDPNAMDFIKGKPDSWGMRVNPSYKRIKVPRSEWPLLDSYIPVTANTCRQNNPNVYFTQLAAPVTALRKVAEALLDAWPNVQTRCDVDLATQSYKLGRIDRQSYGARFMLGIVSLGDVERYGLRAAALQTKRGTYVAPDDASLSAAVDLAEQKKPGSGGKGGKGGKGNQQGHGAGRLAAKPDTTVDPSDIGRPFVLDQADVRKSGKAYPGTMIVYTAAKLRNLAKDDARKVALFIRTATTEGQKPGAGNGELPAGFLPIKKTGPTQKLYASAQDVAEAVEKQTPLPTEESAPSPTANPTLPPDSGSDSSGGVGEVPGGEVPSESPPPAASPSASPTGPAQPIAMPQTEAVSSDLGDRAVPVLLILGLIGIAITSAVRFLLRSRQEPGW